MDRQDTQSPDWSSMSDDELADSRAAYYLLADSGIGGSRVRQACIDICFERMKRDTQALVDGIDDLVSA